MSGEIPAGETLDFSTHLSQTYHPSSRAAHLLVKWLRSKEAYTRLTREMNMRAIYEKGDVFSRLGGIHDLFMQGDRTEWDYYKRHLFIHWNRNSDMITLNYTSYDARDSQKVLETLLVLGNEYLQGIDESNASLQAGYVNQLSHQLSESLNSVEEKIQNYIKDNISVYPKETYSASFSLQNSLQKKLLDLSSALAPFDHLKTRSPIKDSLLLRKKNIQEDLDALVKRNVNEAQQYEEVDNLLRKKGMLSSLYNTVQEQKYMLLRADSMNEHRISVISTPSYFSERSGPYRMKGFFISFVIISLLYWLVKD